MIDSKSDEKRNPFAEDYDQGYAEALHEAIGTAVRRTSLIRLGGRRLPVVRNEELAVVLITMLADVTMASPGATQRKVLDFVQRRLREAIRIGSKRPPFDAANN